MAPFVSQATLRGKDGGNPRFAARAFQPIFVGHVPDRRKISAHPRPRHLSLGRTGSERSLGPTPADRLVPPQISPGPVPRANGRLARVARTGAFCPCTKAHCGVLWPSSGSVAPRRTVSSAPGAPRRRPPPARNPYSAHASRIGRLLDSATPFRLCFPADSERGTGLPHCNERTTAVPVSGKQAQSGSADSRSSTAQDGTLGGAVCRLGCDLTCLRPRGAK